MPWRELEREQGLRLNVTWIKKAFLNFGINVHAWFPEDSGLQVHITSQT